MVRFIFRASGFRFAAFRLGAPLLLAFVSFAQQKPTIAAPDLKILSLEQLSQIEVTSPSKQSASVLHTPATVYVITGQEMQRSGATSIPDGLRLAPEVEEAQIDGRKWSIGIRGFGMQLFRNVLVLIDGREVYTPSSPAPIGKHSMMLGDVDGIEVIREPGGTIWSPNCLQRRDQASSPTARRKRVEPMRPGAVLRIHHVDLG